MECELDELMVRVGRKRKSRRVRPRQSAGMDEQEKQDDFDDIVVEDAASEPTGCLGHTMVIIVIGVMLVEIALTWANYPRWKLPLLNMVLPLLFWYTGCF